MPTVLFLGDSLMEWGSWSRAFPEVRVVNHGICGDTTTGVLHRLRPVFRAGPDKVFLMVGANDLASGVRPGQVAFEYERILMALREGLPKSAIYVHSMLPSRGFAWGLDNGSVREVNERLVRLADRYGCEYLDIHPEFVDDDGEMRPELTDDGVHLSGAGYRLWEGLIREHVLL
jgi:lysophospholipase L1-like esterase